MNTEEIMKLADAYAHCYAFVEDDTMPKARAALEAALTAKQGEQEPVMIYHGGCTIDCGEHGHHNMEMLKLIPAGTKLYTHPAPVNQQLLEALKRISATPLGDDIEMHMIARVAIAQAEKEMK